VKNILLIVLGSISLGLGIIGIFLPLIPTTPFLLLSLWLYMRSSKKLYNFVLTNKYLGPYVKDYISGKGIPIKTKKKAIFLIWLTIGFSTIFIIDKDILKVMLLSIATIVSVYICTRKTQKVK